MLRRTHKYKLDKNTSMNTSFNGVPIEVLDREGYSVVGAWTETLAVLGGTIGLQVSNDYDPSVNPVLPGTWTTLTGSLVTVSGSGSYGWNVADVYYAWVRVFWTRTGGEGVLNSSACVKD